RVATVVAGGAQLVDDPGPRGRLLQPLQLVGGEVGVGGSRDRLVPGQGGPPATRAGAGCRLCRHVTVPAAAGPGRPVPASPGRARRTGRRTAATPRRRRRAPVRWRPPARRRRGRAAPAAGRWSPPSGAPSPGPARCGTADPRRPGRSGTPGGGSAVRPPAAPHRPVVR